MGILVCGLNGAGKSTLGKALARRLQVRFIDVEDLYFPKTDPDDPYAVQRTQEEVEKWLRRLSCPVIRVDGTRPVEENVDLITSFL